MLHAIRCVHRVDVIFDHAFNPSSPLFRDSMRSIEEVIHLGGESAFTSV